MTAEVASAKASMTRIKKDQEAERERVKKAMLEMKKKIDR